MAVESSKMGARILEKTGQWERFTACAASQLVLTLEYDRLQSRVLKITGYYGTLMSAADDDGVIGLVCHGDASFFMKIPT
jgi:hypothetical protein